MRPFTEVICHQGEIIIINGCLRRETSMTGLQHKIQDIEKAMKQYADTGSSDSEAYRCLQVSMIYTFLTGDVCRRVPWHLFDTSPDFIEAFQRLETELGIITGRIYMPAFKMGMKKRKKVKRFLEQYCDLVGVWEEAKNLAEMY